ncbi:ribosomal protein S5 domain 2-type protein [Zychaea mexicana]|uniref:ribosomal protein S5 domain 2-type protein n=1 Tax=Zychaea mexicana TaxID=64656 RepID=UPI0022FED7A0|nr:ribosomal protein S5 domain 2-type protein [Zychaea mexicana]KAI9499527.1 ribosomal protein S5 domain 2-type protein [Zychaea mexicana]
MSENNKDLQEEEYMALEAIYGPDVVKKENESSDDAYIVTINLDDDDETLKSPRIVVVRFFLPPTYPSNDPPIYEVSSVYCGTHRIDNTMLDKIDNEFQAMFQPGEVVLFAWISWLRDYLENEVEKPDEEALCKQLELQKLEDQPEKKLAYIAVWFSCKKKDPVQEDNAKESRMNDIAAAAPPIYTSPDAIVDRKSTFVAHVAKVHNVEQVRAVVAKLLEDKKIAKATHNMMAYRIELPDGHILQDNDDDGETAAGGRMMHLLQITDVKNAVVVVSRWFGGIQLGADRFKHINNSARAALVDCGFIKQDNNKASKNKRKK